MLLLQVFWVKLSLNFLRRLIEGIKEYSQMHTIPSNLVPHHRSLHTLLGALLGTHRPSSEQHRQSQLHQQDHCHPGGSSSSDKGKTRPCDIFCRSLQHLWIAKTDSGHCSGGCCCPVTTSKKAQDCLSPLSCLDWGCTCLFVVSYHDTTSRQVQPKSCCQQHPHRHHCCQILRNMCIIDCSDITYITRSIHSILYVVLCYVYDPSNLQNSGRRSSQSVSDVCVIGVPFIGVFQAIDYTSQLHSNGSSCGCL